MKKHVALFDMDGTITPARKKIIPGVCDSFWSLLEHADIGIVSGSGFDFIIEQCGEEFAKYGLSDKITILPCNGTQKYEFINGDWRETYRVSMKEELGKKDFNTIVTAILSTQAGFVHTLNEVDSEIPVSGSFLTFRGSMINWSVIGRDVTQEERDSFANFSGNDEIRTGLVNSFKSIVKDRISSKLMIALGGQTSIDISPTGWDKQYALKHYPGKIAWFVGDRCNPGENDHLMYRRLKPYNRAFHTSGPEETLEIINLIMEKISSE